MLITIINGPNLNLLGKRETEIYGNTDFDTYFQKLQAAYPSITFRYFQSNVEGELINHIHESGFQGDGIVLNAGGYTHTSVAIADAVAAVKVPVVEVHISNILAREDERKTTLLSKHCKGIISGFGMKSYELAVIWLANKLQVNL